MYCSGCGTSLAGQTVCPQCGHAVAQAAPGFVPGFEQQLTSFNSQMRVLSMAWFVYGAITLVLGAAGLAVANAFLSGHFPFLAHGPWSNGAWPMAHTWIALLVIRFGLVFVLLRAGLSFAAGWGLRERAQWGRVVAVIASIFSILRFPLGTALSIWTLIALLGYRNSTMYQQTAPIS